MTKIWFTSDQHFWHSNIIKYCNRPYATVEDMNEAIITNYNALIGENDVVYHLGDFSLAFAPVITYVKRLNGTKHLIYGNHDFCSHLHPKGKRNQDDWIKKYEDAGFATVQDKLTIQIDGKDVLLHHFPYRNLEDGDHKGYTVRYLDERQEDKGLILLHGHVHGRWKRSGNCIDVGVDVWNYCPVSLEQVKELIK